MLSPTEESRRAARGGRIHEPEQFGQHAGGNGSVAQDCDIWKYVYQSAGVVGVDPSDLTLAQLYVMHEARQRDQWQHTASVLTQLANVNRDPKKGRTPKFEDFYPFDDVRASRQTAPKVSMKTLISLMAKKKRNRQNVIPPD